MASSKKTSNPHEKWLRMAAREIASEGHAGWGNTCTQAADEIARLEERILELEASLSLGPEPTVLSSLQEQDR